MRYGEARTEILVFKKELYIHIHLNYGIWGSKNQDSNFQERALHTYTLRLR